MTLSIDISRRIGPLDLRVAFDAPAGTVTALLGPNGAGKTTVLRAVAGTLDIDAGSIVLGDTSLVAVPGVFVEPEQRRIATVFQDHLLFPHLSALDNVAFGPRCRGRSRVEARAQAEALLDLVGVADRAHARPAELSGGQAQRVALARALAAEPEALLLDEPLAALDATTRTDVRRDLRRWLEGFAGPTVLVTHDPVDALALADRVVVLQGGSIVQSGSLREVAAKPRSEFVADLIGTNLVVGSSAGRVVTTDGAARLVTASDLDGPVFATVAPTAIALHRSEPEGSPRNRWSTIVERIDHLGSRVRVHLGAPLPVAAEITPAAVEELDLREGGPVWASVKATEITVYPR